MAKKSPTPNQSKILHAVTTSGGTASNYSMIAQTGLTQQEYFLNKGLLVYEGYLENVPIGPSGSVSLPGLFFPNYSSASVGSSGLPATFQPAQFNGSLSEHQLYTHIENVLKNSWINDEGLPDGIVVQTADRGSAETGGKWSRPDFMVVGSRSYKYHTARLFELVTFEAKRYDAIDVTAVYEALAHRRRATRSYVLFHAPWNEDKEDKKRALKYAEEECIEHGIGLVIMQDPSNILQWDFRVPAKHVDTHPADMNESITKLIGDAATLESIEDLVKKVLIA